jgi:replicative DNA helicase
VSKRTLPHSIDSEASLLGGILLRNEVLALLDDLDEDNFYDPKHQVIFSAIRALEDQTRAIDEVTLEAQLSQMGKLEAVGGLAAISKLALRVPTADNVVYLDESEAKIFEVTQRQHKGGAESLKALLKGVFSSLDERFKAAGGITGVPSGFTDLDEKLAGFQPGELSIIAARPAMGKTSFALSIARSAAVSHGFPVLLFSLEMSSEQLAERLLCSEAKVDSTALRRGQLQRQDLTNMTYAADTLSKAPIMIDDTPALNLRELRSSVRRFCSDKELFGDKKFGLILLDYLQLMQGTSKSGSREQEISEISRGLKALSKEVNCPIIALSQLNRSLESRPDKRPMPSDLRESGAIEQDADVIMFIYRDVVYNKETESPNIAEIIVGKNRHGAMGTVETHFEGRYTRFSNLAKRETDY